MKVANIVLTNFKKFKNLTVELGTKTRIAGYNETGKTTIADAFFWLFFGKSSTGISDISYPKPIINGKLQRQTDVKVESEVDGVVYSRTLKEKWTKKRGTATKEFTGHETVFEINRIPVKKKDFDNTVKRLFGDDKLFKLLSDTGAVMSMKWDERRKLLVADNSNIDFLTQDLIAKKAARKKLNEQCEELPARIDELNNSITGAVSNENEVQELRETLTDLQNRLASAQNNGATLEIKDQIAVLKAKINDIQGKINKYITDIKSHNFQKIRDLNIRYGTVKQQKEAEANESRNKIQYEIYELREKEHQLSNDIQINNRNLQSLNKSREELLSKYHKLKDQEYDETKEFCTTCGQSLPLERVNTARENFNKAKSETLTDYIQCGKEIAKKIETLNLENEEKNSSVVEYRKTIETYSVPEFTQATEENCSELREIVDTINTLKNTKPLPPKEMLNEKTLAEAKLRQLEIELDNVKGGETDIVKEIRERVQETQLALNEAVEANALARVEDATKGRIEEMREELLRIGGALNTKEFEIVEIENKIREEVLSAESALNAKFRIVQWKLYEQQINGALAPCCTPMVNGIEYKMLNTAMQINAGIDIINALSTERGVNYPLFIDNAESNLNIETTNSQVIELYVRENKDLKIEIVEA